LFDKISKGYLIIVVIIHRVSLRQSPLSQTPSPSKNLEKIAKKRRLLRAENELLKAIEAEASIDLLCLDMGIEEIKREIDIKKRELEALKRNN
jgi:hypothetical protein